MTMDGRRRLVIAVLLLLGAGIVVGVTTFVNTLESRAGATAQPPPPARCPGPAPASAPPAAASGPLVALTWDDGPTPERTPYVLDVLREKGVKATFFLQGSNAERYPELVCRIKHEGHVIGNHSYSHPYFPDLTPQQAEEEIVRTNQILGEILGTPPTLFRYPFGTSSPAADEVLRRNHLSSGILWHWQSDLQGDFECPGAANLERYLTAEAVDQAAILLHDAGDTLTCPAEQWGYLPRAIDALRAQGFQFGVVELDEQASPVNQGSPITVVRR
jgi:peptidoglycan-N-acetylglucosamine deacetylase